MEISNRELLIFANALICIGGISVSICRMGRMNRWDTKVEIQLIYLAYLLFFVASMISYWWGEDPNRIQIAMGATVFLVLLAGLPAWRLGAPAHTQKRFSDFMTYLKLHGNPGPDPATDTGDSLRR